MSSRGRAVRVDGPSSRKELHVMHDEPTSGTNLSGRLGPRVPQRDVAQVAAGEPIPIALRRRAPEHQSVGALDRSRFPPHSAGRRQACNRLHRSRRLRACAGASRRGRAGAQRRYSGPRRQGQASQPNIPIQEAEPSLKTYRLLNGKDPERYPVMIWCLGV